MLRRGSGITVGLALCTAVALVFFVLHWIAWAVLVGAVVEIVYWWWLLG